MNRAKETSGLGRNSHYSNLVSTDIDEFNCMNAQPCVEFDVYSETVHIACCRFCNTDNRHSNELEEIFRISNWRLPVSFSGGLTSTHSGDFDN